MLKKILFPTDNSENSKKVINYVIEIAKKFQAEVILFHSYEFPAVVYGNPSASGIYHEGHRNLVMTKTDNILNELKSLFEAEKIPTKIVLEEGGIGQSIINTVNTENCDLIIMGSRGLNAIERALIGSTSNYVIHHTKKPVMVIN